ncbi:MAG TPA: formyl transferase [Gemmatimonadales bacterium]|nr:formyl transferase [Gemmatimonadales bacterium]
MRLVLLTGQGPEHRYVTGVLSRAFPDELAAVVVAEPPRRSALARWRSYRRRYTLAQIASRVRAKVYARLTGRAARWAAAAGRTLFAGADDGAMPRPDLVRVFPGHNGPECLAFLAGLKPDVIAVYGTGVIREGVMRLAGRAILNLHTGVSPRYRGSDSVFWALHNAEPEWVGATVHVLSQALDAGGIIATVRTPIAGDEDEATLFFKTVAAGAQLYVETIRQAAAGAARPVPQRLEEGREYRFVDRTVAAERRVERLLRGGLLARYAASRRP